MSKKLGGHTHSSPLRDDASSIVVNKINKRPYHVIHIQVIPCHVIHQDYLFAEIRRSCASLASFSVSLLPLLLRFSCMKIFVHFSSHTTLISYVNRTCVFASFLSRVSTAMLTHYIDIRILSVCPSVCPTRSGIISKRLNMLSQFLHHTVAQSF